MELPTVSNLSSAIPLFRALRARLTAIGAGPEALAPLVSAGSHLAPPFQRAARLYHARRQAGPLAVAARLLLLSDAVTAEEAKLALGDLLNPLLDAGALGRTQADRIEARVVVSLVDDLLILSDDLRSSKEAVMGLSPGTITLCAAAFRPSIVNRALDLGCGAGACALVLSRSAKEVVGTDINPRAIAMAKLNASINGITNVDFREGDRFAPVRGEAFDRIASQPPFVPKAEGAAGATFLYGGSRGDEFALSLLQGLSSHLAPGGTAVVMAEWPEHGDEGIVDRARRALGSELDLMMMRAKAVSPDESAASYAASFYPDLGAAFETDFAERRAHFDKVGIAAVVPTITVVRRSGKKAGFTQEINVQSLAGTADLGGWIDRRFTAHDLVLDRERLLTAALRVPDETVFSQEQVGPGADVPSTLGARFSASGRVEPIAMTADLLGLVTILHESASVREGLERFAEAYEAPIEVVLDKVVPSVEQALLGGLLEA